MKASDSLEFGCTSTIPPRPFLAPGAYGRAMFRRRFIDAVHVACDIVVLEHTLDVHKRGLQNAITSHFAACERLRVKQLTGEWL